ncbi:MAG TPA: dephospho-CoA kinase [Candidatus Binataceae bacterium]|nr:dephospho-CoA kinase [Candidatus Binataceae bacterium]
MLNIGLTGGIGCGKSTVTKILAELGATVMDADKIAHSTYAPGGAAYAGVVAAFADAVAPDGTIDRTKLGPIVFKDPSRLIKLQDAVWPATKNRISELIAEVRAKGERKPIVVEAAILIEAKWQSVFDEIWLITAPREAVIERVERERGLKPEQTEARIRAQLPDEERRKHASMVIDNSGTIVQLREQLMRVWTDALKRNG